MKECVCVCVCLWCACVQAEKGRSARVEKMLPIAPREHQAHLMAQGVSERQRSGGGVEWAADRHVTWECMGS